MVQSVGTETFNVGGQDFIPITRVPVSAVRNYSQGLKWE